MFFDYFYEHEADQFAFYMIPKEIVEDKPFCELSDGSKLLYSIILDRVKLSRKNGWIDDKKLSADSAGHHRSCNIFLAEWIDPAFPRIPRKSHGIADVCCKTSQWFAVHHRCNQSTVIQDTLCPIFSKDGLLRQAVLFFYGGENLSQPHV